jgi:magnesium-transporting ATPase (P-type)
MTFVIAHFGIEDKLRTGVFDSIKNLGDAKINVRMISGDNLQPLVELLLMQVLSRRM